jgi:hypothetical protein
MMGQATKKTKQAILIQVHESDTFFFSSFGSFLASTCIIAPGSEITLWPLTLGFASK